MINFLLFSLFHASFEVATLLNSICDVRDNSPKDDQSEYFLNDNSEKELVQKVEVLCSVHYFPKNSDVGICKLEEKRFLDE